jgi:hypothetical protein
MVGLAIHPVAPVETPLVKIGGYATPSVEEPMLADLVVEVIAAQPISHRILEFGERELDARGIELVVEAANGFGCGRVDVGDRLGCDDNPCQLAGAATARIRSRQ